MLCYKFHFSFTNESQITMKNRNVVHCRLHSYFPFSHVCPTRVYQEPCQLTSKALRSSSSPPLGNWPCRYMGSSRPGNLCTAPSIGQWPSMKVQLWITNCGTWRAAVIYWSVLLTNCWTSLREKGVVCGCNCAIYRFIRQKCTNLRWNYS